MYVSYNWLNDFIDLSDLSIAELADLLTMKTCEVEGVEEFMPHLQDIVVAEVKSVEPHPDAQKLNVCKVFDGKEELQIVCGAANVKAGQKYPLARIGVTMPGGMQINKVKLRGVDSSGMLCSAEEIQLTDLVFSLSSESEDGLLTLPQFLKTGASLREALSLNDTVIEIDNKSVTHRPDLWGHFGIARELSSLLNKKLKFDPRTDEFSFDATIDQTHSKPSAEIKDKSAICYSSAIIDSLAVVPSDFKMQSRLLAVGMRPINNVVDVSNYIMLEMGQPNHAFDRSFIKNNIEISFSKSGESLKLLDSKEITLPDNIVLIRDGKTPIALGGVMGGENTEVNESTKTIFLESANFHRSHIRKVVSTTGIRTEASQRFEKGQDPENATKAIHRFAILLNQSCPDLKMGSIDVVTTQSAKKNQIITKISYIKDRLGDLPMGAEKIVQLLQSLGMECKVAGDDLTVDVPIHRSYFDVTIAEDLIEEIGRVVGYNQINPQPLLVPCEVPKFYNSQRELEHTLKSWMSTAYQFNEVFNYAFQSAKQIDLDTRHSEKAIRLKNSVNKDLEFLRVSALPGLLENIAKNHKEYPELRFFELERLFIPNFDSSGQNSNEKNHEESLPEEKTFLAGIFTSPLSPDEALFSLSSMVSDLLIRLGVSYYGQVREQFSDPLFHPGRCGLVKEKSSSKELVKWGQVHPGKTRVFNIEKPVYYFELFIEDILPIFIKDESLYQPLNRYPASDFELTVLMDEKATFSEVMKVVGEPGKKNDTDTFLESIDYLTEFKGESLPQGKKAVSLKVCWRNAARTLEHDEIKGLQNNLVDSLGSSGFTLR